MKYYHAFTVVTIIHELMQCTKMCISHQINALYWSLEKPVKNCNLQYDLQDSVQHCQPDNY